MKQRALLLLFLFSSCAPQAGPSLMEIRRDQEFKSLEKKYYSCLIATAKKYEPVEPAAEVIARAAWAACLEEREAEKAYIVRNGIDRLRVEGLYAELSPDLQAQLVNFVLRIRAQRRTNR